MIDNIFSFHNSSIVYPPKKKEKEGKKERRGKKDFSVCVKTFRSNKRYREFLLAPVLYPGVL